MTKEGQEYLIRFESSKFKQVIKDVNGVGSYTRRLNIPISGEGFAQVILTLDEARELMKRGYKLEMLSS